MESPPPPPHVFHDTERNDDDDDDDDEAAFWKPDLTNPELESTWNWGFKPRLNENKTFVPWNFWELTEP